MATKVFNHQKRVINLTPGIPKATLPGMICRFNYKSDSIPWKREQKWCILAYV